MKSRSYSLLLPAAVIFGAASQAHAAYAPVETFNALTNGALGGQNGWVVTAGDTTTSTVIVDPANNINKVLKHQGTNDAYKLLPAAIPDAGGGTLFYRLRLEGNANNVSFGLSDQNPPSLTDFNTYEVQNASPSGANFQARDGGTTRAVFTMTTGVWYNFWCVINTTGDSYRLYVQRDGDATYNEQTELLSSDGTWNFRNAAAANPLASFAILSNSSTTNILMDDIYVDPTATANLSNPSVPDDPDTDDDGLNDAWEVFYFGSTATQNGSDGETNGDNDGLSNEEEETRLTHPAVADTDGDGLLDGPEAFGTANPAFGNQPTNPRVADSDADGANDSQEVNGTLNVAFSNQATDPNLADTDGDGWADTTEFSYATDPNGNSSVPDVHELIGLVKRNGSFEYRDGVVKGTNFKLGWDGTAGVDNIDGWVTWTEQTTTSTDSGVEAGNATHGAMKGFCQGGNGAKNLSNYKAKAGDLIRLTYDRVNGYATGDTFLLYDGTDLGAGFVQIPTSTARTGTSNGSYEILFKVPAGSPAIGRSIGVGIRNTATGNWPGWDRVILSVQDSDSDNDGLSDFAEDQYFGNNDDNVTPEELLVTTGATDSDGDGVSNADEVAAGSNPNNINSTPGDLDADGLADAWETERFGSITAQDGTGDPDGDFNNNEAEETAATDPNDAASWPDSEPDTLNDGWEKTFFSGSLAQLPGADADTDGFSNLAEMQAGSHPNDSAWTPSVPKLAHRWSFNGNLNDSAGTSPATIQNLTPANLGLSNTPSATALTLAGGARATTDWVQLGTNLLAGKKTPVTIELWATQNVAQAWSRIFDFHSATTENLYMSWTTGTTVTTDRVQWVDGVTSTLDNTNAPYTIGTKYHLVMTVVPAVNSGGNQATGSTVTWYSKAAGTGLIGPQKGSFTTANTLANFGDLIDALGHSPYATDNNASATYDEVRIWDGALPVGARETLHAAGPDNASLADSDGDGLYDAWELAYFPNLTTATGNGNGGGSPNNDSDAATNLQEQAAGSNPAVAASVPGDVDGDTLSDEWELLQFGNLDQLATGDPDGDFDTNGVEEDNATIPTSKFSFFSSTTDTVPDSWKAYFGISGQTGASDLEPGSPVGDGMTNEAEFLAATSPIDRDSDDDGLEDGAEVTAGTLPLVKDTDGDGLEDGPEINLHGTSPTLADTDGDSFSDKYELDNGGNPTNAAVQPTQAAGFEKIEDFEGTGMTPGQTFNNVNGWLVDPANVVIARPNGSGQAGHWVGGAMRKSLTHHARQILNGNTGTLFMQVYMPGSDVSLLDHSFSLSDTTGTGTGDHEAQTGYINGTMTVRNGGANFTSTYTHEMGVWFNVWMVADNASDTVKVWVESPSNATGQILLNESQVCSFRNGVATNPLIQILFLEFDTDSMVIDNLYVDAGAQNLANPVGGSPDGDGDGMPDAWETTYFGGTSAVNGGPAEDFDADGTDNLAEFRLGLIPNRGNSRFAATRGAGGAIQWPSQAGVTFKIERSTTLAAGSWTTLEASYPAAASPATSTSYTDPSPPAGKAFYKITLNP